MRTTRDDGYFPRDSSILRRIHSERAVGLLYGQRALMIGALNPRAFVGTLLHTRGGLRPFKRLAHTGTVFETIYFGTRRQADEVLAFVHNMHERVNGEMPEDAGVVKAGARYSAFDPELMLWTMAVIADSAPYFYELLVGKLSDEEHESLWQEYVRFAELFGMPRDAAPSSYRESRNWWHQTLSSDAMFLTPEARQVGYQTAFQIPMPLVHWPAGRLHNFVMLGSLPKAVREHYGLSWGATQERVFRAAVAGLKGTHPLVPAVVRCGRNTSSFDLVARTEAKRIARGEATPQATVPMAGSRSGADPESEPEAQLA